jgi:DNA-binding NarL/FixJ family response regulator
MRARRRGERAGIKRHELGVLELLADGRPGQEIAEMLTANRRSVREHLVSILLKLAVDDHRRSTLRMVRGHLV